MCKVNLVKLIFQNIYTRHQQYVSENLLSWVDLLEHMHLCSIIGCFVPQATENQVQIQK